MIKLQIILGNPSKLVGPNQPSPIYVLPMTWMLFSQASLKNNETIDEVLTTFCQLLGRKLARKNLESFS